MDLIHLKQTIETYRNEADQAYLVRRVGFNPQIKERRVT